MKTILSCATPDGKISCELISKSKYGSTVYSVHIYESTNNIDYFETHRSFPIGNKHKANIIYKQYCNRWLRNKR